MLHAMLSTAIDQGECFEVYAMTSVSSLFIASGALEYVRIWRACTHYFTSWTSFRIAHRTTGLEISSVSRCKSAAASVLWSNTRVVFFSGKFFCAERSKSARNGSVLPHLQAEILMTTNYSFTEIYRINPTESAVH